MAAQRIGADKGRGGIVAIDLLEMEPVPGVEFAQMDFLAEDAPDRVRAMLQGRADGVISDMAANATGHRKTDHLKIVALVELAAAFAGEVLKPGGFLVAKVLQGGTEGALLASSSATSPHVRHVKPQASRADSAELYVLATGFRGSGRARRLPRPAQTPASPTRRCSGRAMARHLARRRQARGGRRSGPRRRRSRRP